MPDVTLYTTSYCGFCSAAKGLLNQKGVSFEEIDVTNDPATRQLVSEANGNYRTVPMIFVGNKFVGGFQQLSAMAKSGQLDEKITEQNTIT